MPDYTNLPAAVRAEKLTSLRERAESARSNAANHRKLAGQHQANADRENEYADRDEERARQWQQLLDLACEAIPLGAGPDCGKDAHDPAACTECADQHEAEQAADREDDGRDYAEEDDVRRAIAAEQEAELAEEMTSAADLPGRLTPAQLDGSACIHCGREFLHGEASEPLDDLVDGHQLFAHIDICDEVAK